MLKRSAAIVSVLLASIVTAASDPNVVLRREFMQAYAAAERGKVVAADSAALKQYELYPYLQAARLLHDVQQSIQVQDASRIALDQQISAFLDSQPNAPAARDLRRAWLLDLAARMQWELFIKYYRADSGDVELRCRNLNALLATQRDSDAATQVISLWPSPNRLPSNCNTPFQWAQDKNVITSAFIEQRARLALKSGNSALARDLFALLPNEQAEPLRQWAVLIEKPQQAIDALITNPKLEVEVLALQDGWQRLARKDQDAAIERLPRLVSARRWSDAIASPYNLSLALALSWSRRSEALQYFEHVLPQDMSEQAYEWRARAALWSGDWQRTAQAIADMPAALKAQARWRYWSARCFEQLNDVATARTAYQLLVNNDDNYYAAMAAARLKTPYTPHLQSLFADPAIMQQLTKLPNMIRVRELIETELRNFAPTEWNAVYDSFKPAEQLAAIQLAHDWGWYDQAIALASKLGLYNDYDFLYPRPYDAEVKAAAELSGLSMDLIYAQLRQESLYRPDAKSSAGALGLLQLMPDTAREAARQLKLPRPSNEDLYNPVVNIPLGAVNVKKMIDSFNGRVVVGLAAYNGGPNAARRWVPNGPMDTDVWIENIPYNETRTYVQRVLWHSLVFHWLRNGMPLDTQAWLAQVMP